jgi:hypothetical protein
MKTDLWSFARGGRKIFCLSLSLLAATVIVIGPGCEQKRPPGAASVPEAQVQATPPSPPPAAVPEPPKLPPVEVETVTFRVGRVKQYKNTDAPWFYVWTSSYPDRLFDGQASTGTEKFNGDPNYVWDNRVLLILEPGDLVEATYLKKHNRFMRLKLLEAAGQPKVMSESKSFDGDSP